MKLPELKDPGKYVGLYVVDFGDHSGVGFTAEEVAELLESQKFAHCKVYKIHRALPDGTMELKGMTSEIFALEMGMFFYFNDLRNTELAFSELVNLAINTAPPCRAKLHLAKYNDDKFAVTAIYPAEYNDEISDWLIKIDYKAQGPAEGGIEAVRRYYNDNPQIIHRHQLFGRSKFTNRTGRELLASTKLAVQR